MTLEERLAKIELLLLDVDGVLTDGKIRLDDNGVETKAFDVRDGHGLGNVRRRLDAVYGGRGSLSLLNHPEKNGTVARLLLPADRIAGS